MKAFLVNPTSKTITQVEHNGDYRDIYKHIGQDCFTTVRISSADGNGVHSVIFLDDEGLLRENPGPFFQVSVYPDPLAGNGPVLGIDYEGNSVEPSVDLAWLQANISWPRVKFIGFTDQQYTRGDAFVFSRKSNFEPLE